ncbi:MULTISPECIES: helix-turn-helix transcriptional regulator [Actinomyces]|uniref:Helix-turn-helix domain-containing protein n=1 Tax=Actinomyces marmotae TaxID=2737173 RepID=A0A6M8B3L4_9ACTO|nr:MULTISPECIES: helix-turn-helix domain-containing protein [Actinomyces]QKD79237.1 helix-turn-helix domain-containing protein [Actinomyces marmotae]
MPDSPAAPAAPHTTAEALPRPTWSDLSARADLTVARRRVLELVEASTVPLTAAELADRLALHHNTVREHLDALVEAGFVTASTRPTGRRGRPALLYTAVSPDPMIVIDSYLTLLDATVETFGTGHEAHEIALRIGRRWAELSPAPAAAEPLPESASDMDRLAALLPALALMGFAPRIDGEKVVLKACPLVTRSRAPHPLVCAMHEGFLNAIAQRQGLLPAAPEGAPDHGERPLLAIHPLLDDGCHARFED